MTLTVYIARAFCHDTLGGNPAGVVILDQGPSLDAAQMQSIAKELRFSETAFISSTGARSYKILYFTPTSPIDFCGHATVAAFGVLKFLGELKEAIYSLDTQVGRCEITLKDRLIFLSQPLPSLGEKIDEVEVASVLEGFVGAKEPQPQIVSTGLRDIFVRVQDEKCLQSLKPNLELIAELNRKTNSIGIHVFSLNPQGHGITAHCRNFAPLHGINEESATGSSNGALACYLFEKGLLPLGSEHQLLFRQGESLQAPSDIHVHLKTQEKTIEKVECGGEAELDEIRVVKIP